MSPMPHVLVVDDDTGGRRPIAAALQDAGFAVTEAGDGAQALREMREALPDLVLMDVHGPGTDGLAACAELRRLPGGARVPVVMMTGPDDLGSIEKAFEAGATDFVTKPVNLTILAHRVRYMLRASKAIEDLKQSQRRLSNAQRIGEMGDWEWDLCSDLLVASEQAWRLLGHEAPLAAARSDAFFANLPDDDRAALRRACETVGRPGAGKETASIDHRVVHAGSDLRQVLQQIEVTERRPDGSAARLAGAVQDITRRKKAEERIRRLAYHDTLTGLPNRVAFDEQLRRSIAQADRHGRQLAVMFVDLDNFKRVNDTFGHTAGDELLRTAAARLSGCLRAHDHVTRGDGEQSHSIARLGGDEFIVQLTDLEDAAGAATVARRLVEALAEPILVHGTEVFVGGSVGVALYPQDGVDIDTLLKNADAAMYSAKESGRGNFQFYDRAMGAQALDRLRLESGLRRAIQRQELALHYQPRVDVVTGSVVGAEALVRWQHPERGLLLPDQFIPRVAGSGLEVPLGEWVIEAACRQIGAWRDQGLGIVPVAVNLASTHLGHASLPRQLARSMAEHRIPSGGLEVEVTESILLADTERAVAVAREIGAMGVRMSIDDFGTGYSSMRYLKRLPIHALKIDRSFVRDLATDPDDETIVSAIIALAHSLKLKVVAEGVETMAQLAFLRSRHCDEYQGYLTSRPVDAEEFVRVMRSLSATGGPARVAQVVLA